jgi:hypothetical protein
VAHFSRADAKGEGAEGAMRGGVGITADDGLAGLSDAQLGADDVHDAAAAVLEVEQFDAEFTGVDLELPDLPGRGIDGDGHTTEHLFGARGRGVVHGGEREVRPPQLQTAAAQLGVRLWRGHLVREMQIDEQDSRGVSGLGDDHVVIPDLLEHRLCLVGHLLVRKDEAVPGTKCRK